MKLRCVKQESTRSKMFTEGEVYEAKETGLGNCLYEVKDNYDRDRIVPKSSMKFCVENEGTIVSEKLFFAHFEAVDP